MTRRIPLLLTVLSLALLGAAPAGAATPVQIGSNGEDPVIAVGPDGVGHIAWQPRTTSNDITYCRVPAGATTCTPQTLTGLPLAAGSPDDLNIFAPTANRIVIEAAVTVCSGGGLYGLEEWVSTNGGASFTAICRTPNPPGGGTVVPTRGKNYLDTSPGNDRFFAAGGAATGKYFLAAPNSPGPISESQQDPAHTIFSTGNFYDVAVGAGGSGAASYLVAAAYSLDTLQPGIVYSVFNQAPFTSPNATLNNQANWTKDISYPEGRKTIDPPNVVSGPSGVFLVYQDQNVLLNDRIGVARLAPNLGDLSLSRFGAPVLVDGTAADTGQRLADAAQDQTGRIHLIWNSGTGVRYARSIDGGATFQTLGTLVTDTPISRDVAAGPDGRGWIVYGGDGATLQLAPLEPTADAVPTPTPTPTPAPAPVPRSLTRNVVSNVPGASITFGVPKGCVQPGSTFRVTLKWKRKKKKGNKFVKVTRADFYIGTKVVKKDRKAPFVQTLKVTASARRGSTIKLRARAFIKVKKGKAPKKSIKASIKVCP